MMSSSVDSETGVTLPAPAWRVLLGLAVFALALHAASTVLIGYGYNADELYFLDCANHLAWGYVDHPPFSIAALAGLRGALGDSLIVLRMAAAVAGAVAIVFAGLMSREMGGGRNAQGLSGLAVLIAPVLLFITSYYSLNAIDLVVWTVASYLLLILVETFGEAGAINLFGPEAGLPRAIGTHNNYWLWGPEPYSGEVMLAVSGSDERLNDWFGIVSPVQAIDCVYCMPALRSKMVYLCREPRRPMREIWLQLKDYS